MVLLLDAFGATSLVDSPDRKCDSVQQFSGDVSSNLPSAWKNQLLITTVYRCDVYIYIYTYALDVDDILSSQSKPSKLEHIRTLYSE